MVDRLKRIPVLYHFTDRRNLELIRKLGGLYPLAELRRRDVAVPAPGGNEWSWDANGIKGFDEYVHLCFRATHPMEFVARAEGRIGGGRDDRLRSVVHANGLEEAGDSAAPPAGREV